MSFDRYIQLHYATACEMQRRITNDSLMVEMLHNGPDNPELVKRWMQEYGLFQGIETKKRTAIVKAFLTYAKLLKKPYGSIDAKAIETNYKALLLALHKTVKRSWMSATSKLLWCIYPQNFVIYDAFVHRTLVVLQCLDDDLASFPRIGSAPEIKSRLDIDRAVQYYMNYQAMVQQLKTKHQATLDELRTKYKEQYAYDIRIIDKLLWMIGNAKKQY